MKKQFKFLLTALLLVLVVCVLASCGNKPNANEPTDVEFNEEIFSDYEKMSIRNKEVFAFDDNGERINCNDVFVEYNNGRYYVVNNFVVTGTYLVDTKVYFFNSDGVWQDKVFDDIFITINNSLYYVINNVIVHNEIIIIDDYFYCFDENGKMIAGEKDGNVYGEDGKLVADESFVRIGEDIYYLVDNKVVYNKSVSVDGNSYRLNGEGKLVADNVFITINNNVYYIINNVIVYNEIVLINDSFYCFDEEGKMVTGKKDGKTYGEDGKLLADEVFVTINNNVYYIVNNVIIYNQIIIDGSVYDFGDDGKMVTGEKDGHTYGEDGKLVADEVFVTINNNVYYIVNNVIIHNEIVLVGDSFYCFDEEGKMVTGKKDGKTYGEDGKLVGNNVFVTINNNVYYIINNVIIYNQIIIDGSVYDFGDDGKMVTGEKDGHTYGEDGKLVADEIFVTINNNVYYVINNVIVYNQIIIDGSVYDFGDDGKMVTGEKDGHTYGEDGKLVADEIFVTINNNVYYVINNVIVYNQIIIDGSVYDFGDDGKMVTGEKDGHTYGEDGKLVASKVFITINNNVYYVINDVIIYNQYIIHNNKVYYFTETGVRFENGTYDGYDFSSDGSIIGDDIEITIDGKTHHIVDNEVVGNFDLSGTVYESDNDFSLDNNDKLANVEITLTIDGEIYSTVSGSDGSFSFTDISYANEATLKCVLEGYITVEVVLTEFEEAVNVIMDREVSNNLVGTVYIADTDSTISNNNPLAGALVTLERTSSSNEFYYEATTSSSGYYSFTDLTAGVYTLTISKDGYITVTQTVRVRYNETTVNNVAIEAIPADNDESGEASGYITESLRGAAVEGLTVYIYEGLNTTFGEYVEALTTNEYGYYETSSLKPGNYTAYVVDERELDDEAYRYASVVIALKVLPGQMSTNQNATVSNSVGLDIDGMRIVLTWGSSPSDLDSHLEYSGYHVYFGNKVTPNANLDVDDTSSYGPETVTITDVGNYTFKYFIHNWSGYGTMYESQACIKVYLGNSAEAAYTFYPPQGSGYYWDVFSYNALTGEFTVLNTLH